LLSASRQTATHHSLT